MANEFYDNTGFPTANSPGNSQAMRNEFTAVEAGFDKLPTLASNGGKIVSVNVLGTALETLSTTGTGNVVRATDPTFTLTDTTTNNASTTAHGWMRKLSGLTADYYRGDGLFTRLPVPNVFDRSTNASLNSANNGGFVNITAAITQTMAAASGLGDGWSVTVKNSSAADVTIDPNGAELIDGAATLVLRPGDARFIVCDGTGFRTVAISGNAGRVHLGTVTAAGAGVAVSFPNVFSALFDDYEIVIDEMVPTLNDTLTLQFSAGGTPLQNNYGTVSNGTTATKTDLSIAVSGGAALGSGSSGSGVNATITVQNANSTTGWRTALINSVTDAAAGVIGSVRQGAYTLNGTALSGFRLNWSGGANFNRGTVRVYGIRKNL